MLSIAFMSASGASNYFEKDSYYTKNQEAGQWQGKLAKQLGLVGNVNQDDFKNLLQGNDLDGNRLVRLTSKDVNEAGERIRAGVDLTFSAPKSVSVLYEFAQAYDKELADKLLTAHEEAVTKTLERLENDYAGVRKKEGQEIRTEPSEGLAIAKFTHDTTREIEGTLDPQLHTHSFIINLTKDADGNYKSVDYGNILKQKLFLGQEYRNELASSLKEMGFDLVVSKDGTFEIKGIGKDILNEFSQRSKVIESKLPEYREKYPNMPESELKAIIAREERATKKEIDRDAVRSSNIERAKEFGYDEQWFNSFKESLDQSKQLTPEQRAELINEINKNASKILTEQQSTFTKEEFLKIGGKLALQHGIKISELESRMEDVLIRTADGSFTTQEMKNIEKNIVFHAIHDKANEKLSSVDNARELVEKWSNQKKENGGFGLTPGQKAAATLLLSSNDRICLIQGDAGTGKTTMLKVANDIAKEANIEIIGLAYTGKASNEISEASGIKSQTLHSFLNSAKENAQGQIWVVDEASMIGSKQLNELIEKASAVDAKIVLIGDTKQFKSINAGNMFDFLKDNNLVQAVKMEEVLRQKTDYMKAAVKAMSEKKFENALEILDSVNAIKEYRDLENPINGRIAGREALVREYLSRDEERQNNTLIIVQRNSDREAINSMIRDGKGLGGVSFEVLRSANISPSDAFFAESYKKVDLIFSLGEMADGNIKQNETLKVVSVNEQDNTLVVRNGDNKEFTIDLSKDAFAISAYQKAEKQFDEKDKIVFTKNDSNLGVQNGVTGVIEKIDGSNITVRIGEGDKTKIVEFDVNQYNFFDYGYAVTEYSAQGQTAKEVLSFMRAEDGTITQNSVYVTLTRAENDVQIFTDSKEMLVDALEREYLKTVSLSAEDLRELELNKTKPKTIDKDRSYKALFDEIDKAIEEAKQLLGELGKKQETVEKDESYRALFSEVDDVIEEARRLLGEQEKEQGNKQEVVEKDRSYKLLFDEVDNVIEEAKRLLGEQDKKQDKKQEAVEKDESYRALFSEVDEAIEKAKQLLGEREKEQEVVEKEV